MTDKNINTELLTRYSKLDNIAPELDERKLTNIGLQLIEEVQYDNDTRHEWLNQMEEALKIARQDIDRKTYPWDGASNIKLPLILNGCIQFNARTNPEIIQGNKIVNVAVMRDDPTGDYADLAYRQGRHMSYQLLEIVKNWTRDTDKLLMSLPLLGTVFRKTYFDSIRRIPTVEFCLPDKIIINQNVSVLEKAERITHQVDITTNTLIERMRAGIYTAYSLDELEPDINEQTENDLDKENISRSPEHNIKSTNHSLNETHAWLDLDDDGYREPYIVTIHLRSQKVLRIVARFDSKSFIKDNGKVIGIDAYNYFTDYRFLPSPDGAYMGLGFGQFLYPLNESINTICNQLVDAGTLSNIQGGFLSRSLRLKKDELDFRPGEWKLVNAVTGGLQKGIMPLPVKEPSATLFNLLQFLIQNAEQLASINDVLQGQMPAAGTPATTVMAVVEQGQKVYSSIFYRLYESFQKEYEKLYDLNAKYLSTTETYRLAEESGIVRRDQYDREHYGVFPIADPTLSSDAFRLAQTQALMQLAQANPLINSQEVTMRYLKLLRVPNPEKLIITKPQPTAEEKLAEAKIQNYAAQNNKMLMEAQSEAEKTALQEKDLELRAAIAGVDAATQKINSTIALAEFDVSAGQKALEVAQKQEEQLSIPEEQQFEQIVQPQQPAQPQGTQPQQPMQQPPAMQGTPAQTGGATPIQMPQLPTGSPIQQSEPEGLAPTSPQAAEALSTQPTREQ